jgi:hypothetical protein
MLHWIHVGLRDRPAAHRRGEGLARRPATLSLPFGRRAAARPPRPRAAFAAASGLAACWLGLAAAPAAAQSAPPAQFSYFGSVSASDPSGGRSDGSFRSSLGQAPNAQAVAGSNAVAEAFATLKPLASVGARSFAGDLLPNTGNSFSFASVSLSYSVVWTPVTGQYDAALQLSRSEGAFGIVQGEVLAQAEGRAYARARLKSQAGGFGTDGGKSNETLVVCGTPGTGVAPPTGCGSRTTGLLLYFAPLDGTASFVSTISLVASTDAGDTPPNADTTFGRALAFVDPLVTLDSQWAGELVVGGGEVANAIPEPAAAWLLLGGLGLVGLRVRQAGRRPEPSNGRAV